MLAFATGCVTRKEGTYRSGVLIEPGPLALNDHYVFTFLDKWRISHAWLSGPVDIDYCRYTSRDNKGLAHDRFLEIDGKLVVQRVASAGDRYGQKYISNPQQKIYGTNPVTGKVEGYRPFCTHWFRDIWAGTSVFLIKPNPSQGTDQWIANAETVVVNGLPWLRQRFREDRAN
jgi:hypothetical protein